MYVVKLPFDSFFPRFQFIRDYSSIYGQVNGEERQREYEQTGPESAFK